MNWIDINYKNFINITYLQDGSYLWEQNDNCPDGQFLVACKLTHKDTRKVTFDYNIVVLNENGLENSYGDSSEIHLTEVTHWCELTNPLSPLPTVA